MMIAEKSKVAIKFGRLLRINRFNACSVARMQVAVQVIGNTSIVDALQNASRLAQFVTGQSDPFKLINNPQSEQEISERLQCQLVIVPCKSKKGIKEEMCLSIAKKQEFGGIVKAWLSCNTDLYKLYSMPGTGPLTMLHAIHIFDRVLETMFDMRFKRMEKTTSELTIDGRRRRYSYVGQESTHFTRAMPDNTHCQFKPPVVSWPTLSVDELHEKDQLQIGDGVVQPSAYYIDRQLAPMRLKRRGDFEPEDLCAQTKKRGT